MYRRSLIRSAAAAGLLPGASETGIWKKVIADAGIRLE
jgi:hypothetical protein